MENEKVNLRKAVLRFKELRTLKGLTCLDIQKKIIEMFGEKISYNTLLAYERGTNTGMQKRMLEYLATIFDVPVRDLFAE